MSADEVRVATLVLTVANFLLIVWHMARAHR